MWCNQTSSVNTLWAWVEAIVKEEILCHTQSALLTEVNKDAKLLKCNYQLKKLSCGVDKIITWSYKGKLLGKMFMS